MKKTLIVNANIVNEGQVMPGDVLIAGERIEKIGQRLSDPGTQVVDAAGRLLMPGVIDDQVHFREPGLTHKGTIRTESRAAVAGGITTYMEMPNTVPNTFTQQLLEEKYQIASRDSLANYSFYIGGSNDNLEEVLKTDLTRVCGMKIFMGSSTGNLLVDNPQVLEGFFSRFEGLITTHCEHEPSLKKNEADFRARLGEEIPIHLHPQIRNEEVCYRSSSFAVDLAKKHGTRLHILHISTARETELFSNQLPLEKKKITAEACIHHLWFCDQDYERLGTRIKWNPAIKSADDRAGIWKALLDGRIDVIATDHAPHTWEEKNNTYFKAPSGGPLVQHTLVAMLEFHHQGKITLPQIATKMAHNVATLYRIQDRGFIREGYFADLVLADLNKPWTVSKENILAKCGWSPFEGTTFKSSVERVWVSGHEAYAQGQLDDGKAGQRLSFRHN
ncbi:MAG: dihydroorotase [Cyclobacteriaceae bacterium]|jgi:dihydroorotase